MDSSSTGLFGIRQVAVTVSDVAAAKAFYHGILGLKFLFDAGPNLAFLECGPVRILLSTPQGAGTVDRNSTLYFQTSMLEAKYASVVAAGAKSGTCTAVDGKNA